MKDWIIELCPEIQEWQAAVIAQHAKELVESEREACAKVCEEYAYKELTLRNEVFGKMFANAIRARNE